MGVRPRGQFLPLMPDPDQITRSPARTEAEVPLCIRGKRSGRHTIRRLIQIPGPDLRPLNWLAGRRIKHEPLDVAIPRPHDQRQGAHPEIREGYRVRFFAKIGAVTGNQEIETRRQLARRRQLFRPLLEIRRRRKCRRPLQHGSATQQFLSLANP